MRRLGSALLRVKGSPTPEARSRGGQSRRARDELRGRDRCSRRMAQHAPSISSCSSRRCPARRLRLRRQGKGRREGGHPRERAMRSIPSAWRGPVSNRTGIDERQQHVSEAVPSAPALSAADGSVPGAEPARAGGGRAEPRERRPRATHDLVRLVVVAQVSLRRRLLVSLGRHFSSCVRSCGVVGSCCWCEPKQAEGRPCQRAHGRGERREGARELCWACTCDATGASRRAAGRT